ncbi:hypothetical protein L1887_46835 [Cichorium endivia]|nr:hypothetical protein L1887_46835 [Cichorium endivia]
MQSTIALHASQGPIVGMPSFVATVPLTAHSSGSGSGSTEASSCFAKCPGRFNVVSSRKLSYGWTRLRFPACDPRGPKTLHLRDRFFPATAPSFGAGSSQEAESSYARADIPNQNAAQDRIYGLGHSKFVARAYPVDTPLFTHLYSDEPLVPVNFEDYVQGIRLLSLGSAYRPEPTLLRAMQSMIWTKLGRFGFNPMQVAGTPDLVEGQYLWPPLSRDRYTGNVNMPADVLRRLRGTVKDRLRRLRPSDPDLYHLQVNGRHILAFTTKPIYQVNLPFTPSRSDLWMFFEMMAPRDANAAVPHLTLLGSTFLPRGARRLMTSGDVMWPAFFKCSSPLKVSTIGAIDPSNARQGSAVGKFSVLLLRALDLAVGRNEARAPTMPGLFGPSPHPFKMRFSKKLVALALLGVVAIGRSNAMDGEEGSRDERIPVTDDPRSVHYQPDPAPAPAEGSHWRPSSPAPAPSRAEVVQLYPFSTDDRPWTLSHVQAVASSSSNMPASFQKPRVYWQIGRFTTGDGRSYGPYMIGSTRFLLQPYPLDIPVLSKFYAQPGWIPTDFERFGGSLGTHAGHLDLSTRAGHLAPYSTPAARHAQQRWLATWTRR